MYGGAGEVNYFLWAKSKEKRKRKYTGFKMQNSPF